MLAARALRCAAAVAALALGCGRPARPPPSSSAAGLVPGFRPVTVDVPVVLPATAPGGLTAVTLTTAPVTDGTGPAGVTRASGTDDGAWRGEVWLAAFVAASALGNDLTHVAFTADPRGDLDGGASSALLAAGYLASMLGSPIDPAATVTGVVHADGTLGPVTGLPRRLDLAIAAGKRRVGYPAGMGQATDLATGEAVDLEARARDQGATAVELADIHDALELLTGTRLPRPSPVAEVDMALEPAVVAALDAHYAGWHARLAHEWTEVLVLQASGRLAGPLAAVSARAERITAQAARLHQKGQAAAAYEHVVRAWVAAASATATSAVLERVRAGDLAGARARLDELAAMADGADRGLRALGALAPDTLGAHLRLMSAFHQALGERGLRATIAGQLATVRAALDALEGRAPARLASRITADELAALMTPAARAVARTVAAGITAGEALVVERAPSRAYRSSVPAVRRLAAAFRSAAHVDPTAVHEPAAFADLAQAWGEGSSAWALLELAAGQVAFVDGARAGHAAALGVELDLATGEPARVQEPRALAAMLASAERRAREHAGLARVATGSIPVQTRLRYQMARALAGGDLGDQLAALALYRAATAFAQTAVLLARHPA